MMNPGTKNSFLFPIVSLSDLAEPNCCLDFLNLYITMEYVTTANKIYKTPRLSNTMFISYCIDTLSTLRSALSTHNTPIVVENNQETRITTLHFVRLNRILYMRGLVMHISLSSVRMYIISKYSLKQVILICSDITKINFGMYFRRSITTKLVALSNSDKLREKRIRF